jgi:hypothetical protein
MSEEEIKELSKKIVKAIKTNTTIEEGKIGCCLSKVAETSLETFTKKEKQFIVCDWVIERAEKSFETKEISALSGIAYFLNKMKLAKDPTQN